MSSKRITELQKQIFDLIGELETLQRSNSGDEVPNYSFATEHGEVSLLDLFGGRDKLLLIHNMGQGCRYCTMWADGLNGILSHLESAMAVALVSKDAPELQRRMANSRGWRFRLASHGGGDYIKEQTVSEGSDNYPGVATYKRDGDRITRLNSSIFGPGDLYCSTWNLLAMAGIGFDDWTPQYAYWTRPEKMDDGGKDVLG